MLSETKSPKYAFVIVHGDLWGALNANVLVKAVKERGAEPILIVSKSTRGKKSGQILTKIPDLLNARILREDKLSEYFNIIDSLPPTEEKEKPEYLTFEALAREYCADKTVHRTTSGGVTGGDQVEEIFRQLKEKNITPEVVLSGDTMAFLPASVTDTYDCFSTHPGGLEEVRIAGMQGTARAVVGKAYYDLMTGAPFPLGHIQGEGATSVKGSLFKQESMSNPSEIDKGPIVEDVLSPVCPGVCLLQTRIDLYHALTQAMVNHLDNFLDTDKCKAAVKKAYKRKAAREGKSQIVLDELDEAAFRRWQGNGTIISHFGQNASVLLWTPQDTPATIEYVENSVVNPDYFQTRMEDFYPRGREKEFYAVFDTIFSHALEEIVGQQERRQQEEAQRQHEEAEKRRRERRGGGTILKV